MIPAYRQSFNRNFTPEKYAAFLRRLDEVCGAHVGFRVCETPCFFSRDLIAKMARAGDELIHQLVDNPAYRKVSDASVPAEFNVPNEDNRPLFIQVDFGLVREAGEIRPKLVELQAFPSLYAYQSTLARAYKDFYGLDAGLDPYLSGLDDDGFRRLLRRAIVGEHAAENVVLMEIDPAEQKTLPDFLLTEKLCGIATVNIRDAVKQGKKLHYRREGRLVPIERIYNRAIVDELVRKQVRLPFDYRDELDVEWAGHPNWYFRISKFSIPHLKHETVPRTWFLDEMGEAPRDRENYLLKPLYSFAGAGIVFAPTDEQLAAIPEGERHQYIVQERVRFEPVIDTPHGMTQAEVRIMYIWLERLTPVAGLVRMGRGKMMGVDHNKNLEWVGGSAALFG